jgi:glutamate N-acetyltransferase / amino-acid N-acetyltransferase
MTATASAERAGLAFPLGFRALVGNIGIKDDTRDVVIVAADRPVSAAGLYTQSRFAGPSVVVSREHGAADVAQAFVVISKNANVATGDTGEANAREVCERTAALVGCTPGDVLIASTGVIGRQYPMDRVRAWFDQAAWADATATASDAAEGIMTTDTVSKTARAAVGNATVIGIAKGVGMIEPNMATLITALFTDADVDSATLRAIWTRVIDRTFNAVSIDTDTSTSDTAIVLASGAAGPVDDEPLEAALFAVALDLTKQVARDGEGAETLIEVHVDGARDDAQARRVAKAIVNSPLVKTAVHGADPNWGRVAMAIGKCSDETDIDQQRVVIRFGSQEVYPTQVDADGLQQLSDYLRGDEVLIHVSLGISGGSFTAYGCDLTDGYVRINADYTT